MANIIIPQCGSTRREKEMYEREFRTGGWFLNDYISKEKHGYKDRQAKIANKYRNYQRKQGSEFELAAVVDARTFFRWQGQDRHFWEDPKNIEKITKDNPEMASWKHA
jgi:hypothetical protein